MKVLNLYAGIGGNRKLWENVEVTAVEMNKEIADIYTTFFPDDKMVIEDAHQYLLDHHKEFDFIWSSPPCPTHSRMRNLNVQRGYKPDYPDMELYQEIIFLDNWFDGKYCVENIIGYYEPLIRPWNINNHYFWSNFRITPIKCVVRGIRGGFEEYRENLIGFDLSGFDITKTLKVKVLKNCVEPETGVHIFNCAFKNVQPTLDKYRDV